METTHAAAKPVQASSGGLNYVSYLHIDSLLELQSPIAEPPQHDEMLFIVVHQAHELWFKGILHELDALQALMASGDESEMSRALVRAERMMRLVISHLDVLETMSPLQFLAWRGKLGSGSGLQSYQYRAIEFTMGLKDERALSFFESESWGGTILRERFMQPTVWDAFLTYLMGLGYKLPEESLNRDVTRTVKPSPELQSALLRIYKDAPRVREITEKMGDLDQRLQEWRFRHAQIVDRMMGSRPGTAGTTGASHLKGTLFYTAFPDLWAIRCVL